MRQPRRQSGTEGFSLIQLVVGVSVLAVVLAVIAPGLRQASDSYVLRKAAGTTVAELRRAQTSATAEGSDFTVEFFTATGPGNPGGLRVWKLGASTPERTLLPPEWSPRVHMEDGATTFPACVAPADPAHKCLTYKPLGYPVAGGRVRLGTDGSAVTLDVVVGNATGRVTIER